jgi:endo-1,4-beta-xylanase
VEINTANLDIGLKWAQANGKKLRYHTLVWHNQTPAWFFKEGYSRSNDAPWASREVMLARLDNFVKAVMEYCKVNYPGLIYAIDVVNEAIEVGDGEPGGIRSKINGQPNPWFATVGADYIEQAFVVTRKYAPEEAKLFYNDYSTYDTGKAEAIYNLAKGLQEKGLIDGIGMQSHISMTYPDSTRYQSALQRFGSLGLEVQVTEMDLPIDGNTEDDLMSQASRFKRIMTIIRFADNNKQAQVTNVTLWGTDDNSSWLNGDGPRYPLLFTASLQPKPAFYGFIIDESIPLNYVKKN